jgi:hypothetical protein
VAALLDVPAPVMGVFAATLHLPVYLLVELGNVWRCTDAFTAAASSRESEIGRACTLLHLSSWINGGGSGSGGHASASPSAQHGRVALVWLLEKWSLVTLAVASTVLMHYLINGQMVCWRSSRSSQ